MIRVAPFRGVLYNPKKIRNLANVIAPPYDVISTAEQERLYKKSPHNFVRLDLSQDAGSYDAVAQTFNEWLTQGILERDQQPADMHGRFRFHYSGRSHYWSRRNGHDV